MAMREPRQPRRAAQELASPAKRERTTAVSVDQLVARTGYSGAVSQENVELIRQGFEAFARGDIEAVMELMDPDVDWQPAIAPILGVEAVRGRDALRRFFTHDLFEGFDEFHAEPLSFEDFGDTVLVMSRYSGRGASSGLELDQTFATTYTLRDGKTVTMHDYATRTEALQAAGVRA